MQAVNGRDKTWPQRIELELSEHMRAQRATEIVPISEKEWLLQDGGRYLYNQMVGDFLHQPPPNKPRQLLESRIRFHEAKLRLYRREFVLLKGALLGTKATYNWDETQLGEHPDTEDGPATLRYLKEQVEHHGAILQGLKGELESLPEVKAERGKKEWKRQQAERDMERAEQVRWKLIEEIQGITIEGEENITAMRGNPRPGPSKIGFDSLADLGLE